MDSWQRYSLKDLCSIVRGGSPRPISQYITSGEGYNWLKIGDTQNISKYIYQTKQKIKKEGLKKTRLVHKNDFILSNSMSFGKPFIMQTEACIHDGWLSLSISDPSVLDTDFLYYLLSSQLMFRKFNERAAGSSVRNLKIELVNEVEVYLPPLPAQKAIADILQAWDTAIEKTEALIAAKEKRSRWFCRFLIEKTVSENNLGDASLSDIYNFKRGSGISKSDIKSGGKNKCVLYGQLYTTYEEIIQEVKSSTDIEQGVWSECGDLLIPTSTTTSAIDLANVTAILESDVLIGGDINILRPKTNMADSQFMAYYLTHYKKHDLARVAQGITIIHLYDRDIKHIRVTLPSVDKQRKIAETLNTAKLEIDTLKTLADRYRTQKRGLMQKLLTGKWKVKI